MNSPSAYDVIVVGLGTMGAATCWQLARRGLKVLGLERHQLVHDQGAHHGRARMIRQAYFEHPDYVPLIRRAYENWDRIDSESGQTCLHRTGGLYLGSPDGAIVSGSLRAAERHQLAFEMLDSEAIVERFPQFRPDPGSVGFYETEAGYLVPETAVRACLDLARRDGAELHSHETVLGWRIDKRGEGITEVVVDSDRGRYRARSLVLATGAWTPSMIDGADLNLELRITRQVQAWFHPLAPQSFSAARGASPSWFVETDRPYGHYGFPPNPDDGTLKVAVHGPGDLTHPDQVDRQVATAEIDALSAFLRRYLPDAAGPVAEAGVCLYTNSDDGHFIVDRLPGRPQVILACGFSGHGFKFASVIGEALADLASEGHTDLPIGFLGLDRLR